MKTTLQWKYDNRWNTRWSISDSGGVLMKCQGNSSRGTIEIENDDDLLIRISDNSPDSAMLPGISYR